MLNVTSNEMRRLLAAAQGMLNARRLAEAEQLLRSALSIDPRHPAAHYMMGMVLLYAGRHELAMAAFQTANTIQPTAEAYLNLIQLKQFSGRTAEALATAREARAKYPNDGRVACEFGRVLERAGLYDEARALYERGIMLWPKVARVWVQYGALLYFEGDVAKAVEVYRKGVASNPGDAALHSALLYALHFVPGMKATEMLREHAEWVRRHATPLAKQHVALTNVRDAEKRLRVGYVSGNFRNHSVGRFIVPLLEAHDHTRFEIFAYSNVHTPDDLTQRTQKAVDVYRPCLGMSDEDLARKIRADGIDILVDLTMHMPGGRPLLFARQPAPVQVCYLAYVGTTGLPTMQYRLSDAELDPPGSFFGETTLGWHASGHNLGGGGGQKHVHAAEPQSLSPIAEKPARPLDPAGEAGAEIGYTEKTVRVPSYWCYEAVAGAPEAVRMPGTPLTFACLNNLAKVSDEALQAWARILREVPEAQLLLHCLEGKSRERLQERLSHAGVEAKSVRFAGRVPLVEFLRLHQQVDIALDPFPYGGGTTTCDALYMGVPVVTLCDTSAGALAVGRGGASILSQLGIRDLVAKNVDDYVRVAVDLARLPERQTTLRTTLRDRMKASPLMNARQFAGTIEEAYQTMWREYVGT